MASDGNASDIETSDIEASDIGASDSRASDSKVGDSKAVDGKTSGEARSSPQEDAAAGFALEPISYSDIEDWAEDRQDEAVAALSRSCASASLASAAWRIACEAMPDAPDAAQARAYFEAYFIPHRIADAEPGMLTGYYEPEIPASREKRPGFETPLYRRPADLIAITDDNRPADFDASLQAAREGEDGALVPYFDRAEIETGALDGRGLELAWLADPVDAFFVHIQGSARLSLADGGSMRVGYAGKSGHSYTPIGRLLVQRGDLTLEQADMAGIRRWIAENPKSGIELMRENRSFIFFAERADSDPDLGPVGSAGVQLTAGRSLAVDPSHHVYGTPVWIAGDAAAGPDGRPLANRLMIAQDSGSAIKGPQRGDFFVGTGKAAGDFAGALRSRVGMIVLLPRGDR